MITLLRRNPIAPLASFLALGGTSYAAGVPAAAFDEPVDAGVVA